MHDNAEHLHFSPYGFMPFIPDGAIRNSQRDKKIQWKMKNIFAWLRFFNISSCRNKRVAFLLLFPLQKVLLLYSSQYIYPK